MRRGVFFATTLALLAALSVSAQSTDPTASGASAAAVAVTPTPAPDTNAEMTPTPTPPPAPTSAVGAASPSATPTPIPAPAASASPTPTPAATPFCNTNNPGETCITAEAQGREEGHIWARGFTDLQMGELHIQTDALDIYDVKRPDGSVGRELVAEGNVVLLRNNERMSGTRMTMNLDTGRGVIDDAVGYLEPGIFLQAHKVERLSPTKYRIVRGTFTSCCQPNPRWSFWTPQATLKVDDYIMALSPTFLAGTPFPVIKKVPLLWLPGFVYPIESDGRTTGLLTPDINIDFKRGVDVRFGFFWAMHRSWDQTIFAEYRPKLSPRLGHELRYALDTPSQGQFLSQFFPPQEGEAAAIEGLPAPNKDWEYDLKWNAIQMLPAGFRAKVIVDQSSPQNISADLVRVLDTQRKSSLIIQNQYGPHAFSVKFDSRDTIVGDRTSSRRYMPQALLSMPQTRMGGTGLIIEYQLQLSNLYRKRAVGQSYSWWRVDAAPVISRPFAWSFLRITPRVETRGTWYEKTLAKDPETGDPIFNDLTGESILRRQAQVSVELVGPQFSKVFVNSSGIYSERFKHVIGPEITWSIRSVTNNTLFVQQFDTIDMNQKEHALNLALVQRFYAKRKIAADKSAPFEVASWRVYQTYYVDIPESTNDPNFTSSIVGPGNKPAHWSPMRSEVRLTPTPSWSLDYRHEYDVNFHGTTSMELSTRLRSSVFDLRGMWMRSSQPRYVEEDVQRLKVTTENLTGDISIRPFRDVLELSGAASYDRFNKRFIEKVASMHFKIQCFGLLLQFTRRELYGTPDQRISFAIELEGLGSIGIDPSQPGMFQ